MTLRRLLWLSASILLVQVSAGCTGSGAKPVRFAVIDRSSGEPFTAARLRAAIIETNQQQLPVQLAHLREANERLNTSATTDERGLATLRLYTKKPSLIEVIAIDLADPDVDAPPAAWVYDPSDRSLTRVRTYGEPSGLGARLELLRR